MQNHYSDNKFNGKKKTNESLWVKGMNSRASYSAYLFATVLLLLVALQWACDPKDTVDPVKSDPAYGKGVYISCEGPFQSGSGTISYYNPETGKLVNDVFMKVNGRPLGNIVQSITIWNGKAYIVINNGGKIEVADLATFKSVGVISGFSFPRYFVGINAGKAYVSDWSNNILVVNLQTNAITKSIPTGGLGPERMLLSGNKMFVLNSGGWDVDNLLTIINTDLDAITDTLRIGDRPTGIVKGTDNTIYVMCSGRGFNGCQSGDTKGSLLGINPGSLQIVKSLEFPATDKHPEQLAMNHQDEKLYYLYQGGVFEISPNTAALPTIPLISSSRSFYALGYDAVSKRIYASDPGDYYQDAWVFRYNPLMVQQLDSFKVGIIPGNFFFQN